LNLTPTNLEPPPPPQPVDPEEELPVWLERAFLVVYVLFCVVLGLVLVRLPWTGLWFDEGPMVNWPATRHFLHLGFVRGAVSGLGFLDIWVGILEVAHYLERRRILPPST